MYWQSQAIFDSKGSKMPSSGATRIPTFLWCDQDSNLPLVRPGFQLSSPVTRIPTFLWCDQDSNLPLVRPGFQPSSGATRIPTFLWCDQDSNLPLVPGFQPSAGVTRIPTFLWRDQAANPLKSIPMSRHLLEMPAECQTVQMCLPLTALALYHVGPSTLCDVIMVTKTRI